MDLFRMELFRMDLLRMNSFFNGLGVTRVSPGIVKYTFQGKQELNSNSRELPGNILLYKLEKIRNTKWVILVRTY
jgi:hypothetical protein